MPESDGAGTPPPDTKDNDPIATEYQLLAATVFSWAVTTLDSCQQNVAGPLLVSILPEALYFRMPNVPEVSSSALVVCRFVSWTVVSAVHTRVVSRCIQ